MSRNGSGTYSLPVNSWNPATNGTPATAADYQALINDIAAAITQSLSKDGQTAMTGNLPAGGNKITGLAAGTTAGDSVRYEQLPATVNWRGYIDGLQMSASGSTMTTSAGVGMDSTNVSMLTLDSAIAKTAVGWAVGTGAGGLDTGAIANSTWYHFYLIRRPDTGVVDSIFSTSASAPTLPANYTQYRYYGSGFTDGAGQWTAFTQKGDYFRWATVKADISAAAPGTGDILRALTVPLGVSVQVFGSVRLTSADYIYISDPASTAESADANHFTFNAATASGTNYTCRTNTSRQVRTSLNTGSATLTMFTEGYYNTRGRDA